MHQKRHILLVLAILFNGSIVLGQNKHSEKHYINNLDRSWLLELPLWVPGFRGQLAFGDVAMSTTNERESKERERLSSILGIEFYFVARAAYRHNKWWFQLDAFSGRISGTFKYDRIISPNQATLLKVSIHGTIPRLNVGYAVWQLKSEKNAIHLEVIPCIGLRYFDLQIDSEVLDTFYTTGVRPSWIDPIIGVYIPFSYKRFLLNQHFDFGRSGNRNSWSYIAQVNYRISKLIDVKLGWTHIDINHIEPKQEGDLELNTVLTGPSLGIGFRF